VAGSKSNGLFLLYHRGDRGHVAARAAAALHRGSRWRAGGRQRHRTTADRRDPGPGRDHRRGAGRPIRARHRRDADRPLGQRSQTTSTKVANSPRSVIGEPLTPPMTGDPDPAAVSRAPLTGNPGGVRIRTGGVSAGNPDPSVSAPAPISWLPNHRRPRRWRDHFLLGRRRSGWSAVSRSRVTLRLSWTGVSLRLSWTG